MTTHTPGAVVAWIRTMYGFDADAWIPCEGDDPGKHGYQPLVLASDLTAAEQQLSDTKAVLADVLQRASAAEARIVELEAELKQMQVGPIERDEDYDRSYIRIGGGWEIQTQGNGSTFRIAGPHEDDRLPIEPRPYLHDTLTRMAIGVNRAGVALLMRAEAAEAVADRRFRLLVDCDEVATKRGNRWGVCDCIDNEGEPYQSQALRNELTQGGRE